MATLSPGKSPCHSPNARLGGLQVRWGTFREEEGPLPVLAIRPQFPGRLARIPITTLGPVHAVSNPFCATLYNVPQTRRTCAMSHEGDVELKGCQ